MVLYQQRCTPVDSVIWAMTSSRICRRTLGSATSSATTMALAPAMICTTDPTAELAQHGRPWYCCCCVRSGA